MDWLTAAKNFNLLVEQGSFTAAASAAEVSPSTMSKRIDWLEKKLGQALFVRTTRHVSLTEAGRDFLPRSRLLVDQFDTMISETLQFSQQPSGTLRLAANSIVGSAILMPCIQEFLTNYPKVKVKLDILPFGNRPGLDHDLVLCKKFEDFNSAVHKGTKLITYRIGFYASPDYLVKHKEITRLEDILEHKMILTNYYRKYGRLEMANGESCILTNFNFISDNVEALLYAAVNGMGLFFTSPIYLKNELKQGLLVPVLPEINTAEMELWGFYPKSNFTPIKTRLFLDLLKAKLCKL